MVKTVHQIIWSLTAMAVVLTLLGLGVYLVVHQSPHRCPDGIRQVYYSVTRHYDDSYSDDPLDGITKAPVFVCQSGQVVQP